MRLSLFWATPGAPVPAARLQPWRRLRSRRRGLSPSAHRAVLWPSPLLPPAHAPPGPPPPPPFYTPPPLTLSGHRTGTTLVHNMLAQDPALATPTVFHCGFPSAFLWLLRFSWLFAPCAFSYYLLWEGDERGQQAQCSQPHTSPLPRLWHALCLACPSAHWLPSIYIASSPCRLLVPPPRILDETRPMDNMRLSFDSPCEDELATNVLTSGLSPYA